MELKEGYKQTEAGSIPDDWVAETTANLVALGAPICYGVVQVGAHTDSGVPIVAIKFVKEISHAPLHRTAAILEAPYVRSRVKGGDVLISIKGTIGRVGIVPEGFDGNISRELARLRIKEDHSSDYVAHQLEAGQTQERISRAVVGTTRLEFSIATLREFDLPLPPTKAEQEAIAEALSDADALIESLEQLITKKRQIKQGAMQELLSGKRRLPGFGGEWADITLGSVALIKTGSRNNQDKANDGEYPFFVRSATVERINSYSHNCEAILIPGEGGIGSIFHYIDGQFDVHQRVYAITGFSETVSGKYIYRYMSEHFGAHAMENSVKATVDSLRLPTFQNFAIRLPYTLAEQIAIAEVISDVDEEIKALETKLAKARQLKQGMMHELLTGNIRLIQPGTSHA